MTSFRTAPLLVAGLAAFALVACGKKEQAPAPVVAPAPAPAPVEAPPPAPAPVAFAGLNIGEKVDEATKAVTREKKVFAKTDTIYAGVATTGTAASATLSARWTYGADNQLVDESSQTIAPTGPATTTFHIAKPDGWPTGSYKVDISLNGQPVATESFEVE